MRAQYTNENGFNNYPLPTAAGGKIQSASNMQFSLFVKILIVSLICFHIQIAETTFSDFEGAAISVPDDTLNWFQVGLLKTMFLLLVLQWINGALPLEISLPLDKFALPQSEEYNTYDEHTFATKGMYLLEPVVSKGSTVDETHLKLYQKSYFSLQKAIKFFDTLKRIISALCLTIYEFVTKMYYFWYG
ncbi:uncharacterized protein LOC126273401 [Schistocerca gregaria]|uniref:uncharacterized protein LOC126273401 n=1 Tax=Schistocerca gregaria TaxID=7010 RepID=UPI00211EB0C5|nr:uncharacterized protein LOC126273401 [Schistocerca gregaria]